jgi:CRP-like cAMP-binding protein
LKWEWNLKEAAMTKIIPFLQDDALGPDALRAALSHVDPRPENLPLYLEDPSPALPGRPRRPILADTTAQGHRDNRLLAALPPDTLALLDRDLRQVSLQQGAILLEPGDRLEDIYFPQTGLISLSVLGRDGGTIETATVGREGAVGLHGGLGGRRSFTRATTQIAGRFSAIRAERFAHIANGSAPVRDLILRYTEVLLAEAQQISACNAMHGAGARLCRWLM